MKKLPVVCPSCEKSLAVSELSCTNCDTMISGNFSLPVFLQLNADEQEFILAFVMNGGSLKKMAKELQKSYPTVRNVLDDLIEKIKTLQNTEK